MKEIKPINNNGAIQLKFTFAGKRYSLNPLPGGQYTNPRDLNTAKAVASQIQNDILAGHFDNTLNRYRIAPKADKEAKKEPVTLLTIWDAWVEQLNLPVATKAHHYKAIRQQIIKANPLLTDASWFIQSTLGASTFNQRLGYLKACGTWAVSQGQVETNPYAALKPRKATPKEIKPFTEIEIKAILDGFEKLAPHYCPFVKFLLATGVRTSEAIGLRWRHVDLNKGEVVIQESLSRDWAGNGYQRVRKETKSGGIRYLYLPQELIGVLEAIKPAITAPDALVFTTVKGKPIDDGNFRERYWVKVLAHVGVAYRHPYTTRHTTASHGLEQGLPITSMAYLLGHKDTTMVSKTYGHLVNRPKLPDIL